ncbi:MAG: PhzF family phenazine biosynthesis isomerase [Armatimonadetes bacterium]|nr:PhzF family phenazine biosynthesis isomerase [Armatimonadota bacterium]
MACPIYVVDAFASAPFKGNPAAVCFLNEPVDSEWMQNVAAEMKHAETAFLWPTEGGWSLRWFTPTVEVALCGHATLASAHALWSTGRLALDADAVFHTVYSGELTCRRQGDAITMDFPAKPVEQASAPHGLEEALGVPFESVGLNGMDYLVKVGSESLVRTSTPNHAMLSQLPVRGVIITAEGKDYDFISRFYAPGSGVPEDSVTGSAHCALGPFWAERLGKTVFRAYQASPRGGEIGVEVHGDRVRLSGTALTVLSGELLV